VSWDGRGKRGKREQNLVRGGSYWGKGHGILKERERKIREGLRGIIKGRRGGVRKKGKGGERRKGTWGGI